MENDKFIKLLKNNNFVILNIAFTPPSNKQSSSSQYSRSRSRDISRSRSRDKHRSRSRDRSRKRK